MSSLDLESLLTPIAADNPSGPDLEYDPDMAKLEEVAKGSQEQQYGDTIIEAEPPDWKLVCKLATGLLNRTKDIRIAICLGNGCLSLGDLSGFADCVQLIDGYLTQFWETVHPQLDADDDNDPTSRVNALVALCDRPTTLFLANRVPIVQARGLGGYSLLDIHVARGDVPPPANYGEAISSSEIDAVFENVEVEALTATLADVNRILTSLQSIESRVTQEVGASNAMSLDALRDIFASGQSILERYLSQRSGNTAPAANEATPADAAAPAGVAQPSQANGEINSRADVIRAIERICDYYQRVEPSSPLPLLLNRAKRLATKSFLEIIKDLTPDALAQASAIGGGSESATDDEDDD